VVRSSPRVIAPDWRERISKTPPLIWVVILIVIVAVVVIGPASFPGIWVGIALLVLIGVAVIGGKAVNARVVITPDFVESRDALRRSVRCDRAVLAAWVVGQKGSLKKVFLVDREGKTQVSLAWDSYSDKQLDQIRNALQLPDETD
jgi:hypothetical protein